MDDPPKRTITFFDFCREFDRTVEGLSVVAISYYAVNLLKYLLDGLVKTGLIALDTTVTTAALLPLLVVTLWFFLHRLTRRALKKPDGK